MFENIGNFFKKMMKTDQKELLVDTTSKDAAKERLHIVLMQDRANVSADFLELMKQEIIDVIKKYIVIDEEQIDVRLTNQENEDGTTGAPSLYANIPILNIRNDIKNEVLSQASNSQKTDNLNNIDFNDKTVMIPIIEDKKEKISENKEEPKEEKKAEDSKETIEKENDTDSEKIEEVVESIEKGDTENNSENAENKPEESENEIEEINPDSIDELESEEFDDEDDDDVTFDDLLKAAEEEEKKEAEEKAKLEKEEGQKEEQEKKTTSNSVSKKKQTSKGKGKKKGTKSTSKKRK